MQDVGISKLEEAGKIADGRYMSRRLLRIFYLDRSVDLGRSLDLGRLVFLP